MTSTRAVVAFLLAILLGAAAVAQEGHPLTGTWYGDYGSPSQKRDLTVIMKWDGKAVSGLVNPGPGSTPLKNVIMDITPGTPAPEGQQSTTGKPPIFNVKFELDGATFQGKIENPVAVNRRISGTWTRGAEKGTFQLRRL